MNSVNELVAEQEDEEFCPESLRELPAWFTARMMTDHWHYGLLTVTNHLFYVNEITNITKDSNGELWLDVLLAEGGAPHHQAIPGTHLVTSPTSRTKATIKASTVVAAFELADT